MTGASSEVYAPVPASREVWWYEARAEAMAATRALGRLILATLVVGMLAGVGLAVLWLR